MVKSRFPGKPSKHFNRRKVSGVNSEDSDSVKVLRDTVLGLSYFNFLFNRSEEDNNSFHGFSPHEDKTNYAYSEKKPVSRKGKHKRKGHPSSRNLCSVGERKGSSNAPDISASTGTSMSTSNSEDLTKLETGIVHSLEKKSGDTRDESLGNQSVSGKFVLPSRSMHSSRVIKPNKRFLQTETSNTPLKRSRILNSKETGIVNFRTDSDNPSKLVQIRRRPHPKNPDLPSNSGVKFVLRKPRLKIKTQSLHSVGGPFSSPVGNSLSLQGVKNQSPNVKKVFCGVCGSLRTFRFFRQARKFGIFSCIPCRKFILRIIRSERNGSLKPHSCISGMGNCPIRQNTLASKCFSIDTLENISKEGERCEACWLNLCLRSFHMPQKLTRRLTSFLPQILQKSIAPFNSSVDNTCESTTTFGSGTAILAPSETRIVKRNKGTRESINIRRGSTSAALRLSSHRGRGIRETEDVKRGRGRQQKLPVSGPRVKHVCRSASLVLGQPVATFDPGRLSKDCSTDADKLSDTCEATSSSEATEELAVISNEADSEKLKRIPEIEIESPHEDVDFDYPPIARMLQDLGKANCELLDGMENHEFEKLNARVSIDFWESYDPEEIAQMGFPLIGFIPLKLRSICFLCGSAGLEKMIHCASCCEPYHPFCVTNKMNPDPTGDWWCLDWLCPKCTQCVVCLKAGGSQLSCTKCQKSYHSNCVSSNRLNICDNNWICPDCLFCKSCNDSSVHVFVGNMPLCKVCFTLRQKGNFCPLCQCCYDENDYNTKMMECAECKCWIHARCEGISNEKYQVLSYLPPSIEFICRLCCKNPPAHWSVAVDTELKAGYLNVIKILSKNKNVCAMFKASPKKQKVCDCLDKRRNPIHLSNLGSSETSSFGIDSPAETSPERDYKSSDLGLLTPKLTKDDEESLKIVKSDFLNLVTDNEASKDLNKKEIQLSSRENSQLLTIVCDKLEVGGLTIENSGKFTPSLNENHITNFQDRTCTCEKPESSGMPSLSLLSVKNKANNEEYHSVVEFHTDMEKVTSDIGNKELIDTYKRCLKQIFPWFDPNINASVSDVSSIDKEVGETKKQIGNTKQMNDKKSKPDECSALKGLLNLEQSHYYIGMDYTECRSCLLCKKVGEGLPKREGRLLYCGQNDWVHTNCALWSSEVFEEIDGSLQNVYSAVSRARLIRCSYCGKKGASVGCCAKSCPSAYHFGCAFSAKCVFLESKEFYCNAHRSMKGDKETHKEEDFFINRSVYVELDHKKLKDVLLNQVKVYIGSLEVNQIGEIVPDFSDNGDVIIPCDYWCSRLFWSCKEPWKIVRYSIKTKIITEVDEFSYENDTNYTMNHSDEFTPPPSPIELESIISERFTPDHQDREIKATISHIIETICSKEEEGTLSDQQNTDLLLPELTDVIYNDLPKDFLDGITVNDIFTKMNFDDTVISENKGDKNNDFTECITNIEPLCRKLHSKNISKGRGNKLIQVVNAMKPKCAGKIKDCQVFLDREQVNKWKRHNILQVDGAMDMSESDQSNDSCDVEIKVEESDEPVKCGRCRRTYRTSLSYQRHLPTCSSDYLSLSESDLSDEEKPQGVPDLNSVKSENCLDNASKILDPVPDSSLKVYSVPLEAKSIPPNTQNIHFVQNAFENSVVCVNNSNASGLRGTSDSIVNINYSALCNESVSHTPFPSEQTLVTATVEAVMSDQMVELQQPSIIVQQMSSESVVPSTFMPTTFQEPPQPSIQYITAINTQEKTHLLAANGIGSTTYHIQPQLHQPLIQNVPTVLGTIVQSNGVEQIVLNNSTPNLDVYGQQQNNVYISNAPMIVGMETVVSNTVMQSSRFFTGTPGMLASSYSATTTQVCLAAKPLIDIPQSYVVVNTNPTSIIENGNACIQSFASNGPNTNSTWNNYKINYQDAIKLNNKSISFPNLSQPVVNRKQDINGIKIRGTSIVKDSTLMVPAVEPPMNPVAPGKSLISVKTSSINNVKPFNPLKAVELPSSSAVHKEKPQQAVAPVVIKKVIGQPVAEQTPRVHCNGDSRKVEKNDACTNNVDSSGSCSLPNDKNNQFISMDDKNCLRNEKVDVSSSNQNNGSSVTKRPNHLSNPVANVNGLEHNKKKKMNQEVPKMSFEISSDDGFYLHTTSLDEAWVKVYETVQNARKAKNLPPLTQNPFSSPDTMLKKLLGLSNNGMKYLLEQLPGIGSCSKYKPVYHKKAPSALEKELYRGRNINPSGCARSEKFRHTRKTYDMFSWLASRHRRPPKLLHQEFEGVNGNSRRATSMSLPMAMRFRHLKETSKHSVGVFRSDIHGRGLFCLRDIDSGEMVIEYAGEVIRSALTDKRERYYTEKGIGCYMFRIDDKFVVDATMKGNAARFINHSCEPNCYSKVIDILGKKHILIFALRKILQGEELTYDYKFPLEDDKIDCHCLSRLCGVFTQDKYFKDN